MKTQQIQSSTGMDPKYAKTPLDCHEANKYFYTIVKNDSRLDVAAYYGTKNIPDRLLQANCLEDRAANITGYLCELAATSWLDAQPATLGLTRLVGTPGTTIAHSRHGYRIRSRQDSHSFEILRGNQELSECDGILEFHHRDIALPVVLGISGKGGWKTKRMRKERHIVRQLYQREPLLLHMQINDVTTTTITTGSGPRVHIQLPGYDFIHDTAKDLAKHHA